MKTRLKLLMIITLLGCVCQAVGQMSFAAVTNYPVSGSGYCVIATDVNGNGTLDLVTADDNRTLTAILE